MKKFLLAAVLVSSFAAHASHWREFKENEIDLTNSLLRLCPSELVQLMTPYSSIVSAKYVGGLTPDGIGTGWNIVVETNLPAPSFSKTQKTLSISELIRRVNNPAPDAPGSVREVKCTIED